jgi:hypothetical protein
MTTVFVRHRVNDYAAWRKVYDDFAGFQDAGGVLEKAVYRSQADENDLLVMHRFASSAEAQTFLASAELKDAMVNAGVQGAPQIDVFDEMN